MTLVNCSKCGRALHVALTTREIESGEIAPRLCSTKCRERPTTKPARRMTRADEGFEAQEDRLVRLAKVNRDLSPAVASPVPKFTPRPSLTERLSEAEILAGLTEYHSMAVSASQLARRWGCEPEDIYRLDMDRSKAMARKMSAESAEKLGRARSLRQQGETLRYIAEATGLSISYLSQKLKDVATAGMKQAGYGSSEPADSDPDVEELTAAPGSASEALPDGAIIDITADSEEGQSEADESDLDELAKIMRRAPEESELWSLAHKLRNEGASQSLIQRETGFSRGKIRRRLWPSKPRPPTTPVSVDQLRRRLVSDIDRLQNALKAVDVLLEGWTDTKEPDPALVFAAAAVLRSVGIRHA